MVLPRWGSSYWSSLWSISPQLLPRGGLTRAEGCCLFPKVETVVLLNANNRFYGTIQTALHSSSVFSKKQHEKLHEKELGMPLIATLTVKIWLCCLIFFPVQTLKPHFNRLTHGVLGHDITK